MLYTDNTAKNNTKTHAPVCLACARGSQSLKRSIGNIVDHAEASEKAIEKYFTKRAAEHGLLCLKYSNPNMVGYPDRLLVLRDGGVIWVELKSKGRKPTKIQQLRMKELSDLGHVVKVIDNKADIDELFKIAGI